MSFVSSDSVRATEPLELLIVAAQALSVAQEELADAAAEGRDTERLAAQYERLRILFVLTMNDFDDTQQSAAEVIEEYTRSGLKLVA